MSLFSNIGAGFGAMHGTPCPCEAGINAQSKASKAGWWQRLAHQPEIGNQRALKGLEVKSATEKVAAMRKQKQELFFT